MGKESACNEGDAGSVPELGRSHSSILAWRIPGMTEPVELPSMGSRKLDTSEAT